MSNVYLLIDGIPGECQEANHANWIKLKSWGTSVSLDASFGSDGKAAVGDAWLDGINCSLEIDSSYSKLLGFCAQGGRPKSATIDVTAAGSDKKSMMKIDLTDVIILNVGITGTGGSRPSVSLGLDYRQIAIEYFAEGGKSAGKFTYDRTTQKVG